MTNATTSPELYSGSFYDKYREMAYAPVGSELIAMLDFQDVVIQFLVENTYKAQKVA